MKSVKNEHVVGFGLVVLDCKESIVFSSNLFEMETKTSTKPLSFSMTTFNVLADCWVNKDWYPGVDPELLEISNRLPLLIQSLKSWNSDIYCLQEVEAHVAKVLVREFGEEYLIPTLACNRPTSASIDNGTLIMVRKSIVHPTTYPDEYFLYPTDHIWVKNDGDASKSVKFLTRDGKSFVHILNCHFDFTNSKNQFERAREYLAYTCKEQFYICCGDFNMQPSEIQRQLANVTKEAMLHDVLNWESKTPTLFLPKLTPHRVDFILYHGKAWKVSKAEISQPTLPTIAENLKQFGSDHAPIHAVFECRIL